MATTQFALYDVIYAEGKAERVLVGNKIYEMNPNTGDITANVILDKNGKIDSIVKYDDEGYRIQEVILAKGNKPKVVTDLSWDGGVSLSQNQILCRWNSYSDTR